jgi:hypothetical protein
MRKSRRRNRICQQVEQIPEEETRCKIHQKNMRTCRWK